MTTCKSRREFSCIKVIILFIGPSKAYKEETINGSNECPNGNQDPDEDRCDEGKPVDLHPAEGLVAHRPGVVRRLEVEEDGGGAGPKDQPDDQGGQELEQLRDVVADFGAAVAEGGFDAQRVGEQLEGGVEQDQATQGW